MKPETESQLKQIIREELKDLVSNQKESSVCPGCVARDMKIKDLQSELSEEKKRLNIPSYIPSYKCKDCTENHRNQDYRHRPKSRCGNCGQFNPHSKGRCLWCGNDDLDPVDEDELVDIGIRLPDEVIT